MGPLWWVGIALLGVLVGFVAGLFGVGGGFLLNPLLALLFGVRMEIAVGTGLCQMLGTATAAGIRYRKLGVGEPRIALILALPAALGTLAGKRVVDILSAANRAETGLRVAFLGLLFFVIFQMARTKRSTDVAGWLTRLPIPLEIALAYGGLLVGFLSGLLGIGGGILLTPMLVSGLGMTLAQAAGTSVLLLLSSALTGTWAQATAGRVNLPMALVLLIGSSISAQFGAQLAVRLAPEKLRRAFLILLITVGAAVVYDLWRLHLASSR
ncbi:MAG: sulfite exporter TauE/SafE family protein [Armatimonas sp.]